MPIIAINRIGTDRSPPSSNYKMIVSQCVREYTLKNPNVTISIVTNYISAIRWTKQLMLHSDNYTYVLTCNYKSTIKKLCSIHVVYISDQVPFGPSTRFSFVATFLHVLNFATEFHYLYAADLQQPVAHLAGRQTWTIVKKILCQ